MESRVRLGAAILILLALALAAIVAHDVDRRVGKPFAGFMVFENGTVGPPFMAPRPTPEKAGLSYRDQILAVEGRPLADGVQLWSIVDRVGPGVPLRYSVARRGLGPVEVTVPTETFTREDFVRIVLPSLLGGILMLIVVAVPILLRPGLATGRVLFAFGWGLVTNYCFLAFDYFFAYRFQPYSYAADFLAQAALLHLALTFPERRWPLTRHPRVALVLLYGLVAARIITRRALGSALPPSWIDYLDTAAFSTFLLGYTVLSANVAYTALRSPDPYLRQRARVVVTGPVLALVVFTFLALPTWSRVDLGVSMGTYVMVLWVFPVSMAYAMLKHNLFEFDAVARRGLTLGTLALGGALVYLAAFWGLQQWAGGGAAWASAVLSLVFLLVLTLAVEPLRRRIEAGVERAFFPEYRRAAETIHEASRELARLRGPDQVGRLVRDAIAGSVRSDGVRLVVGPRDGALREIAPDGVRPALVLEAADPLTELVRRGATVNLEEDGDVPSRALRGRLEGLGAHLLVPLPFHERTAGGFLLGPRTDGRLYTSDDETFLETLAAQAAVAIENARAFEEIRELQRRLAAENVYLRQEIQLRHDFADIVGESVAIRAVLAQVEQVGPTDATVLVQGETGTGKELVVRALHATSKRRDGVLVRVACAAIPETLFESELFGHERGAFTGASARQLGRFELADRGTIFLDDVDTLPLSIQAKLLRATQDGEIQRLGSPEVRRVDARVIAATNKNLAAEVRAGRFREDLYYRLNVVPVHIPPLRERPDDIPLLVQHFVARECAKLGRTIRAIAEDALGEMRTYAWPGNVRELRNVVERAVLMSTGDVLRLPGPLRPLTGEAETATGILDGRSMAELLRAYKVELITRALALAGGSQRRAAELLGLHRPSLTRMIRDLGMRLPPDGD